MICAVAVRCVPVARFNIVLAIGLIFRHVIFTVRRIAGIPAGLAGNKRGIDITIVISSFQS